MEIKNLFWYTWALPPERVEPDVGVGFDTLSQHAHYRFIFLTAIIRP